MGELGGTISALGAMRAGRRELLGGWPAGPAVVPLPAQHATSRHRSGAALSASSTLRYWTSHAVKPQLKRSCCAGGQGLVSMLLG